MPARGRPETTGYEDEFCERLAAGDSVEVACEGLISPRALYSRLARDPEFAQMYARAREFRGDSRAERIDNIMKRLEIGEVDCNTAKVLIDTIKWQCAHERPHRYGDRTALEHSGPGGAPLTITVTHVR